MAICTCAKAVRSIGSSWEICQRRKRSSSSSSRSLSSSRFACACWSGCISSTFGPVIPHPPSLTRGAFLQSGCSDFPPSGLRWGVPDPPTARRAAMVCQAACDQGRTTLRPPLAPWSQPPAPVLARGRCGMRRARAGARSAVRRLRAAGRPRPEPPVRQRRRAWDSAAPRQRGGKRPARPGAMCWPRWWGWGVRGGPGPICAHLSI